VTPRCLPKADGSMVLWPIVRGSGATFRFQCVALSQYSVEKYSFWYVEDDMVISEPGSDSCDRSRTT